jgi:hypothetical protein
MIEDKNGSSRHPIPEDFKIQPTRSVERFTAPRATYNKGRFIYCERYDKSIHKKSVDIVWPRKAQRASHANRNFGDTNDILNSILLEIFGVPENGNEVLIIVIRVNPPLSGRLLGHVGR